MTSTVGLSIVAIFSPNYLPLYPEADEEVFECYAMLVGHLDSKQ